MNAPPGNKDARLTAATVDGLLGKRSGDHQPEENVAGGRPDCKSENAVVSTPACPPPNQGADRLTRILTLIPEAILLPAPARFKGCNVDGWGELAAEIMQDEDWLARLRSSPNIAVRLGANSHDICTIDIDDDDQVEPFLALNPALRESLRTKGARGCNIWLKMRDDAYPPLAKIVTASGGKWGEWRGSGGVTMIAGTHPNGRDHYRPVKNVPPVAIAFSEINWPEGLTVPSITTGDEQADDVTDELVERCGNPVVVDGKGRITGINEAFWAGLMATENLILHDPDESAFYLYDEETGLYQPETAAALKSKIARRMLDESRANKLLGALESFRSDRHLAGVIAHLKGQTEERDAFAKSGEAYVHLANGVLVIEGDECRLEPFSPGFRSRNRSPIPFNPAAECPRFLNELLTPAVSPDDAILLQKMTGQALLGQNLIQRFTILDGLAERGKTTFANVLQHVTGLQNVCQLRTQHLTERFEIHRFLRKTLLIGVDVDADFLSSKGASVIKGLVGGDWFDTEAKGGNGSCRLQGRFNILMTSNARLKVRLQGDTGAWKRRLLIVRYEAPPPRKKIPGFADLLVRMEGSGILNWALRGLGALLADVRELGDIRLSEKQDHVVDSLLAESDSLRRFLQHSVMPTSVCDLSVDEIIRGYAEYCPEMGWAASPEAEIQRQLPTLMLELFKTTRAHDIRRNGRSVRGFHGVTLNPHRNP